MAHGSGTNAVAELYKGVINDVISQVREAFLDENVDIDILQQLRTEWEGKVTASGCVDYDGSGRQLPVKKTIPVNNVYNNNSQKEQQKKAPNQSDKTVNVQREQIVQHKHEQQSVQVQSVQVVTGGKQRQLTQMPANNQEQQKESAVNIQPVHYLGGPGTRIPLVQAIQSSTGAHLSDAAVQAQAALPRSAVTMATGQNLVEGAQMIRTIDQAGNTTGQYTVVQSAGGMQQIMVLPQGNLLPQGLVISNSAETRINPSSKQTASKKSAPSGEKPGARTNSKIKKEPAEFGQLDGLGSICGFNNNDNNKNINQNCYYYDWDKSNECANFTTASHCEGNSYSVVEARHSGGSLVKKVGEMDSFSKEILRKTRTESQKLNTNLAAKKRGGKCQISQLAQLDGAHGLSESSSDDDELFEDDNDNTTTTKGKLLSNENDEMQEEEEEEEMDEEGQDEEPLNSNDDQSDDEDLDSLFDADNVIVCQFEKIHRARNRWKLNLKDGVMHLLGKDYVFQKATGEAEW